MARLVAAAESGLRRSHRMSTTPRFRDRRRPLDKIQSASDPAFGSPLRPPTDATRYDPRASRPAVYRRAGLVRGGARSRKRQHRRASGRLRSARGGVALRLGLGRARPRWCQRARDGGIQLKPGGRRRRGVVLHQKKKGQLQRELTLDWSGGQGLNRKMRRKVCRAKFSRNSPESLLHHFTGVSPLFRWCQALDGPTSLESALDCGRVSVPLKPSTIAFRDLAKLARGRRSNIG